MPRRVINVQKGEPLLNIASYARRGPGARLSIPELELITHTARRTPEVMVKVSGGATSSQGALAHLAYIDRRGQLEIETDQGEVVQGKEAKDALVDDWDLDLLAAESRSPYRASPVASRRSSFTTSCCRCRRARRREATGSEPRVCPGGIRTQAPLRDGSAHGPGSPARPSRGQGSQRGGRRLNIRKATLRGWRRQFAAHLRAHGIAANATERAVRGQTRGPVRDGIYRAALRGQSTHHLARLERIAQAARSGRAAPEPGAAKLRETRRAVVQGWHAVADRALEEGLPHLAEQIWKLIGGMPPPRTEDERLRSELSARMDGDRRQERDARSR